MVDILGYLHEVGISIGGRIRMYVIEATSSEDDNHSIATTSGTLVEQEAHILRKKRELDGLQSGMLFELM